MRHQLPYKYGQVVGVCSQAYIKSKWVEGSYDNSGSVRAQRSPLWLETQHQLHISHSAPFAEIKAVRRPHYLSGSNKTHGKRDHFDILDPTGVFTLGCFCAVFNFLTDPVTAQTHGCRIHWFAGSVSSHRNRRGTVFLCVFISQPWCLP